jgi:hypothetical protein
MKTIANIFRIGAIAAASVAVLSLANGLSEGRNDRYNLKQPEVVYGGIAAVGLAALYAATRRN